MSCDCDFDDDYTYGSQPNPACAGGGLYCSCAARKELLYNCGGSTPPCPYQECSNPPGVNVGEQWAADYSMCDNCPSGFHLKDKGGGSADNWFNGGTWYDPKENKRRPVAYDSGATCWFHNACAPNNPSMPPVSNSSNNITLQCCLDQVDKPAGKCGKGYCSGGNECSVVMAEYCNKYGYDKNCKAFLQTSNCQASKKNVIQKMMEHNYVGKPVKGNDFNESAVEICSGAYNAVPDSSIAGTCDPYLLKACAAITDYDDLKNDLTLTQLCGCFLDQSAGSNIYTKFYNDSIPYNCTPPCIVPFGVKPGGGSLGGFRECDQSSCVMDNITIEVINSIYKGNFNFEQICPNSGTGGNTQCWISDDSVKIINSEASKNNINLSQHCGTCNIYKSADPKNVQACPRGCGDICGTADQCGGDCPNCVAVGNTSKCGVGCAGKCTQSNQCVDESCPACIKGMCQAIPNCQTTPCPTGFKCGEDKKCHPECVHASDCRNNEICKDGMCQVGCVTNQDCGINHICVEGKCKQGCINSSNCVAGLSCVNGICSGGGRPGGTAKNFWDKNKAWIIALSIIIPILIIIIVLVVRRHRRRR